MKILVADDSATVRLQVRRALIAAGYAVVEACDGEQAVELATRETPDLAILDIVMPDLDGYAVCQQLKRMGSPLALVPIVFLTRAESHALELLGQQWGAYLPKPVSMTRLVQVVKELTAAAQSQPEAATACPTRVS